MTGLGGKEREPVGEKDWRNCYFYGYNVIKHKYECLDGTGLLYSSESVVCNVCQAIGKPVDTKVEVVNEAPTP